MGKKLYFKDGQLFAHSYIRLENGGRGAFYELSREQLAVTLKSKFNQELPKALSDEKFWYYWCQPMGRKEKVYWQVKSMNDKTELSYAVYHRGLYYIAKNAVYVGE